MAVNESGNNELLATPKTHQRSDSSYSRNYSLIDIYDDDNLSADSSPAKLPANDNDVVSAEITSSKKNNHSSGSTDTTIVPGVDPDSAIQPALLVKLQLRDSFPDSADNTTTKGSNQEVYLQIDKTRSGKELLLSDFDRYGFKKVSVNFASKKEYNSWYQEYDSHLSRRRKKWDLLMKNNGLSIETSTIPTRFPPKSDKVKKLIRKGIPPEWRGNAWFFYAGGYERLNKNIGIYEQIVENTKGIHNKDTEVIERDLNRTFPDNRFFNELAGKNTPSSASTSDSPADETEMITSLRRVLIAFAHYQPQIGYCQSLNFLAGLLLIFMSEEHAFWMLVITTERIIPKVHSANLEGVHTDQGVLMLCVKEYIPQLWSILGKTFDGNTLSPDKILSRLPPVTLVTSSWFMSLFVGILPLESLLRVWDILWYEGSKTIFRISLTIFKLCFDDPEFQDTRSHSGGAETEQIELFQFMQNFPKTISDPDLLIDNCFKKIGGYGFGSLSQDEINKCREFVAKQRSKLQNKKNATLMTAEMSEEERIALNNAGSLGNSEDEIHDIYGFHRSIMSGVAWNKNISNKMKKRFTKKSK